MLTYHFENFDFLTLVIKIEHDNISKYRKMFEQSKCFTLLTFIYDSKGIVIHLQTTTE